MTFLLRSLLFALFLSLLFSSSYAASCDKCDFTSCYTCNTCGLKCGWCSSGPLSTDGECRFAESDAKSALYVGSCYNGGTNWYSTTTQKCPIEFLGCKNVGASQHSQCSALAQVGQDIYCCPRDAGCTTVTTSGMCVGCSSFGTCPASTRVDPCSNFNCGAHGSCVPSSTGTTGTCVCSDGYTGSLCSNPPVDPCLSVDCGSHGTCSSSGGVATCTCRDGYTGSRCATAPAPSCDRCDFKSCYTCNTCGLKCGWCSSGPFSTDGECRFAESDAKSALYVGGCYNGGTNWYSTTTTQKCPVEFLGCKNVEESQRSSCSVVIPNGSDSYCCPLDAGCTSYTSDGMCVGCKSFGTCPASTRVNPCENYNCGAHGSCVPSSTGTTGTCVCYDGYTGSLCSTPPVDPCSSVNCGLYGICSSMNGAAVCSCSDGYTGSRCEIPPPTTVNNPCSQSTICGSHGICNVLNGQATCSCTDGYSGVYCTNPPISSSNACSNINCNNGYCVVDSKNPSGYRCSCSTGYTGSRCDIVDTCPRCDQGVCDPNTSKCTCFSGYTGPDCDVLSSSVVSTDGNTNTSGDEFGSTDSSSGSSSNLGIIIGSVVGGCVVLGLLGTFVYLRCIRPKTTSSKTDEPTLSILPTEQPGMETTSIDQPPVVVHVN